LGGSKRTPEKGEKGTFLISALTPFIRPHLFETEVLEIRVESPSDVEAREARIAGIMVVFE
jgi:hypothetical protein